MSRVRKTVRNWQNWRNRDVVRVTSGLQPDGRETTDSIEGPVCVSTGLYVCKFNFRTIQRIPIKYGL